MLLTDLLDAFGSLVANEASVMSEQSSNDPLPSAISSLLVPQKSTVVGLLINGLKSAPTRLPAVHGLSSLVRLPGILTDTELGYVVLEASEFVEKEPDEIEDVTYVILYLFLASRGY